MLQFLPLHFCSSRFHVLGSGRVPGCGRASLVRDLPVPKRPAFPLCTPASMWSGAGACLLGGTSLELPFLGTRSHSVLCWKVLESCRDPVSVLEVGKCDPSAPLTPILSGRYKE